jgi:hypothetical protein
LCSNYRVLLAATTSYKTWQLGRPQSWQWGLPQGAGDSNFHGNYERSHTPFDYELDMEEARCRLIACVEKW